MGDNSSAITKPKLWEFAVIWDPTEKQYEAGERSKIIVPLDRVLAVDEGTAFLQAGRAIPDEYIHDQLDQCRVVVRPF